MTTSVAEPAAPAQPVTRLTAADVAAMLERGGVTLIDLREPSERTRQGAIPGAVHAPWGLLEFWEELTMAYYRARSCANGRVILHCGSGRRSTLAALTLQQMGYTHLAILLGGFEAWQAADRPVCADPAAESEADARGTWHAPFAKCFEGNDL